MSELEKLRAELSELNFQLSCCTSFVSVMAITSRLKELEHQIMLMEAGKPREEPREYVPGGKATAIKQPRKKYSSPFGGHCPYKVLFPDR